MEETEVWDWLNFFSETFLDQLKGPLPEPSKDHPIVIEEPYFQLKGQYCRTKSTRRALQSIGKTQIDFLVKDIDLPKEGPADWEKVKALGEFTISPGENQRKRNIVQLSRSVREVFCAQPLRRFLHGFCLFEEDFELWLFDRSGAYSSGPKNIVRNKKLFVRAISSYLLMSDEELGCDMSILHHGEDKFVQFPKIGKDPGQSFEIKSNPIVQPMRLITRGTTCYETKDKLKVIKYSWTSSEENTEIDFLNIAKSVRGVVNCLASEVIYETKSHLDDLNLLRAIPWDLRAANRFISRGIKLKGAPMQCLKRNRRLIRIAMIPRGRSIYSGGSILEFVAGIRDAIKGHEGLVAKEVLHGDVSEGNIILLNPSQEDDLHGMLIDLDHSVKMKGNLALEDDRSLTGTMKFMALERLQHARDTGKSIGRTCRHDLESFFYVFIIGCIEYEDVSANEANDLNDWCTNDVKSNFKFKRDDIQNFDIEILDRFTASFKGLKELAEKLRQILFHDDGRYIETPVDCGPLYSRMIKALDKTVEEIRAGRIENKIFEARRN
ncbi:BgTH12-04245 [Blumeria graminis f. sp. triticale]|uniref:BgTH12-04245 n=1 Tax=Blumeria graminis f. sp. triticale TaxID=1689686 RepID=A0A9W4CXF8_BLUGR|nr:BgTH12-04245 [Blumeria graminis f. sp. triticale]